MLNKNINTNSMANKSENITSEMDTNVLSAIAPKLANTTKIINTKAWDNLFVQQKVEEQVGKKIEENVLVK